MAISYARLEFVKRSSGKNAVAKSAYNSRAEIRFNGNSIMGERNYNWSHLPTSAHHEILLPGHVDTSFLDPFILWNAVEQAERKKNAVVSNELVLALPDDEEISLEDRITLTKSFVHEHFISKGFASQINVHSPENSIKDPNGEYEDKGNNWHAHIQVTPRRFLEDGKTFEKNKPREQTTSLRGGRVISGPNWGKLWSQHQNEYFEQKGLSLRVDSEGVVPQKHLGPYRMRGRAMSLISENDNLIDLNKIECGNPEKILEKLTESKNVFSLEDVERFFQKHVLVESFHEAKRAFWNLNDIVPLLDKNNGQPTNFYSTKLIIEEEKKILRLADKIQSLEGHKTFMSPNFDKFTSNLTDEQSQAFKSVIVGRRLACIDGHAGTGKSHLLISLKKYYESQGLAVRAFGPDNATAKVLEEKGFDNAENVHRFLFAKLHNQRNIVRDKEVWMIDEAGKLGNKPLMELLKEARKSNTQVIFSGSVAQMSSVERGGFFNLFCERYGSQRLVDIQRQKFESQREMAKSIATGDVSGAINKLCANRGIHWSSNKEEALHDLVQYWAKDSRDFPVGSTLIIARSNKEIRLLNQLAREELKERGQVESKEYQCETAHGDIVISVGDRVEFRKNDKELGVTNGASGILIKASEKEFTVSLDGKGEQGRKTVKFDPGKYRSYQLGYASTGYRSQGRTVERAYVLHSPGMNKKEFYVGVTRHVKNVHFFLSREEAKSLSHLKWNLDKADQLYSTTQFTIQKDIANDIEVQSRNQQVDGLKQSDHLMDHVRGHTLSFFGSIKQRVSGYYMQKSDQLADSTFYKPEVKETTRKGKVIQLAEEGVDPVESLKTIFAIKQNENISSPGSWILLSKEQKSAIEAYYSSDDQASTLRGIVESESKEFGKSVRFCSHFSAWQTACGRRNHQANHLIKTIPKDDLKLYFGAKSISTINERSDKYLESEEKKDSLRSYFSSKTSSGALNEDLNQQPNRNGENRSITNAVEKLERTFTKEEITLFLRDDSTQSNKKSVQVEQRNSISQLPEEKRGFVQVYQKSIHDAILLREVVSVEAESSGKDIKLMPGFKNLQKAWGERNKNANALIRHLKPDELSNVFGENRFEAIRDQAKRFEEYQEKFSKKLISYDELEKRLCEKIEPLLYQLYPDGPSRKEGNRFRYNRKGSLCINIGGGEAGKYYDFENQEGGGLLKLISKSQNVSKQEAEKWAKDFLNISDSIEVPKNYLAQKKNSDQKESSWIPTKPPANDLGPDLSKLNTRKRLAGYRPETKYAYRDFDGGLLFYTVRLVKENDPTDKQVLPLSFGSWKNQPTKQYWEIKQYASEGRPLYNLHLLKERPNTPILIVEGEKSADASSKLFPNHVCISWPGGCGAVSKTDWSPLQGKEITIWPDNDKSGFKAASDICTQLRKQGVRSLRVVREDDLTKYFPDKWDLADPIPNGKSVRDISDMVLTAQEKGINPEHVLIQLPEKAEKGSAQVTRVNEVLWRVDERLRKNLENQSKKPQEIREFIVSETLSILGSENSIKSRIKDEIGAQENVLKQVSEKAILFRAEHGREPSLNFLNAIQEKIRDGEELMVRSGKEFTITTDGKSKEICLELSL